MTRSDKPGVGPDEAAVLTGAPVGSAESGFFGHPRGLATLFFTELWERFSYYGMRALLVLYMTAPLEAGGLGYDAAKAGAIYGVYTAMVYLTAVPGGLIADRLIGQRRAILAGGLIIALGHVSLALPSLWSFFLGLGLVILGTGLLKPNISTIVGSLYREGDPRRDGGFSIFYMGINIGGMLAPLVCGTLAQDEGFRSWLKASGFSPEHSWHWGFGAAAVGMGLGLVQLLLGGKHLGTVGIEPMSPLDPQTLAKVKRWSAIGALAVFLAVGAIAFSPSISQHVHVGTISAALGLALVGMPVAFFAFLLLQPGWTTVERKRLGVVFILFFFSALFWSAFEQAGSTLNLFADRFTSNSLFGWPFPSSWFQSVNSFFIILLAPVFAWLWVWLKEKEPSSPAKFMLGLLGVGLGFAVLAIGAQLSGPEGLRISPIWLLVVYLLHTLGELCLSPVGLSLVTKLAPARAVGQLMGVWFMSISLGNFIGGQVAGLFEKLPLPQLFGAIFVTTCGAALLLALLIRPIRKLMGGVH